MNIYLPLKDKGEPLFLINNFLHAPRIFFVEITTVRLPASHLVNKFVTAK